jgi:hypothetical protein
MATRAIASASLAAIVIIGGADGPASACSCVRLTAAQMATETPVLFEGEVVATRRTGQNRQLTTFRIVRAIKGISGNTAEVESGIVGAACGFTFENDLKGWVIGAERDARGILTTNRCKMLLLNQDRQ